MEQSTFCYKTGDYYIVLEAGIRSEILALNRVHPVPFAPDWCVGLAGVRGELFPVLNMHKILLNRNRPEQPYLLWLKHEQFEPVIIGSDSLPVQMKPTHSADHSDNDHERIPGLPGWIHRTRNTDHGVCLEADHGRLLRTLLGRQKR